MATTVLNRNRYSGKDFASALDELNLRAQQLYGDVYNDFYASGVGPMLLDLFAYVIDNLAFYTDRTANDLYLSTSQIRRIVALLTRQLGYKMAPAVASTVDLTVSFPKAPFAFDVPIPKGFQWNGPNQLVFETTEDAVLPKNTSTPLTTSVREGVSRVEVFSSNGLPNQVFTLAQVGSQYIAEGSVTVYVAGVEWAEQEFLTFAQSSQYEVGYNDVPPTLRFGDGTAGNIPPRGSEIRVLYTATSGRIGQATSGTITEAKSLLVVNFQKIDLEAINSKNAGGGDDPESLDHAQVFAPMVFKSRDVAVVQSDFDAIPNTFVDSLAGKVAKAKATSVRSAQGDATLIGLLYQVKQVGIGNIATISGALNTIKSLADDIQTKKAAADVDVAALSVAKTDAGTQASTISTQDSLITGHANTINGHKGTIGVKTTATRGQVGSNDSQANAIVTAEGIAASDAANIKAAADAIKVDRDTIAALPGETRVDDVLVTVPLADITTKYNTLVTNYNDLVIKLTAIQTAAGSILSTDALINANQNSIDAEGGAIGDGVTGILGAVGVASTALVAVNADLTTIGTKAADITVQLGAVLTDSNSQKTQADAALAAVVDPSATLESLANQIQAHEDTILSNDSMANLVTVPILTRDANGFLTAPSAALILALGEYLKSRTEATVTVDVMDGSSSLVFVDGYVKVSVLPGFVKTDVLSRVQQAIDDMFRSMDFDQALRIGRAYDLVGEANDPVISGVGFANIRFTAAKDYHGDPMTGRLTSEGDVVPNDGEIVTKGSFVASLV